MFKKIKEYFVNKREYKNAKKTVTLMLMNQYYDFLVAETEAKEAEKAAYESMNTFGDNFKVEDLQKLIGGIDKIANDPDLTTKYFQQVNENAHKERNAEVIRDTVTKVTK